MTDESTVLNNLRTAHYGDWGLDLSSQDVHELWADIETRDKRIAELEAWINKFIAEGEYLSLLNGIVPGDSNFDKLVEGYFEERER